ALNTTASTTSSVAGSPYAITASQGTLSAPNYAFEFVDGQLTITKASSVVALASSVNPSEVGHNVDFTAVLSAVAPSTGLPTGAVQFITNGVPAGDPVPLSSGVAIFSSSSLGLGTNAITAENPGDGNFDGNTNSLNPPQVVLEHVPVAAGMSVGAIQDRPQIILVDKLLARASEDIPASLSISDVSPNSTNGGTVTLSSTNIIYTPATNFIGIDMFTYTVEDDSGGTATASVVVKVLSPTEASLNLVGQPTAYPDGVKVRFAGVPGYTYTVERSTDLANWTTLGTYTVPEKGIAEFTDPTPPADQPYYRTAQP